MKKVAVSISIGTLYALFFQATPYLGIPDRLIFGMALFAPVVILYMVYVILKYGKPSSHTFDERFYDDFDYVRNGKEEMDAG